MKTDESRPDRSRAPEPTPASRRKEPAAARDESLYPASEAIGLLLRIALFGLRSGFSTVLARHKVTWAAWYYLRVLWEADGLSQRELTERVGAMQPNAVTALRSMEKSGLVRIERPAGDRRSTRIWLTAKARNLMRRMLPELAATMRPLMFKGFSAREEAELRRLLNKLCDNVRRRPAR